MDPRKSTPSRTELETRNRRPFPNAGGCELPHTLVQVSSSPFVTYPEQRGTVKLQGNTQCARLHQVGTKRVTRGRVISGLEANLLNPGPGQQHSVIVRGLLPLNKGAELKYPGPRGLMAYDRNTRQAHIKTLLRRPLHNGFARKCYGNHLSPLFQGYE